jgi:hypothetical protein
MEAGGYKGQGIPSAWSRSLRALLGGATLALAACATALLLQANYQVGLGIVGVAAAAVVCARFPAASVTIVVLLTGAYGSLTAFFAFPAGPAVDLVLGGLWWPRCGAWSGTSARPGGCRPPWWRSSPTSP